MSCETLETLLQIRGNGTKSGLDNWQRTTATLINLERKLLGVAAAGGRYEASFLAIAWARRASQDANKMQLVKALDYAIEQLQGKSADDLHTLNTSILASHAPRASSEGPKKRSKTA